MEGVQSGAKPGPARPQLLTKGVEDTRRARTKTYEVGTPSISPYSST